MQAALFGGLQFGFAFFQLLVEEHDGFRNLAPVAGDVFFPKDVDQFLHDILRQGGIFRVGQIALADFGAQFEQIVLFALDRDVFRQTFDRGFHFALIGYPVAQLGCADDFFQIDRTCQRLANADDFLRAVPRDADLFGQYIVQFDEDARFRFIGVRDQRDEQPAHDGDAPGHGKRQPPAMPDGMKRRAQFFEYLVHRRGEPLKGAFGNDDDVAR